MGGFSDQDLGDDLFAHVPTRVPSLWIILLAIVGLWLCAFGAVYAMMPDSHATEAAPVVADPLTMALAQAIASGSPVAVISLAVAWIARSMSAPLVGAVTEAGSIAREAIQLGRSALTVWERQIAANERRHGLGANTHDGIPLTSRIDR